MQTLVEGAWLARRPCFGAALVAMAAVWATDHFSIPAWVWAIAAGVSCLTLFTKLRVAAALVAMAAMFGSVTAAASGASRGAGLPEEAPVVLRGVVKTVLSSGGERARAVLAARQRRVGGHWLSDRSHYGVVSTNPIVVGDSVEISGRIEYPALPSNPAGYDARHAWLRRGVGCVVRVRPFGYRVLGKAPQPVWRQLALGARERILTLNRRTLSPEAANIANNFLVGDRDLPDPDVALEIQETFRNSGTLHLLVVSGTQVGLVLWSFLWLAGRWWRGRYLCWTLGLGALGFFYAVTDGDASISRATILGVLTMGALVSLRRADGENCLGAAALILLALNPFTLWDVGAQLSFAAVWALLRVAPALEALLDPPAREQAASSRGLLRRLWTPTARVLASSAAAHLATAPLLALHFHTASWSAVLANGCIALLASFFMFVALAHVTLAGLGLPLLAGLAELNAQALYGWAKFFAQPPWGTSPVYPPPLWLLPGFFGLLVLTANRPKDRTWVAGTTVTLVATLFLSDRTPSPPPPAPTFRAVDIGQGDALLLQGRDGSTVLVDTGPPAAGSTLTRTLRALRVGSLDALLISHAHLDHIGGLPVLADEFPPRAILHEAEISPSEGWHSVAAIAAQAKIPLVPARAGDRVRFGRTTLTMLGPLPAAGRHSENEESLVALWESEGARVLLTGDIGITSEQDLLAWGTELKADLLKVGHHGSNGSTSLELLQAVHPRLAVVSCGRRNRFGHPGAETLDRLQVSGVPVLRTDQRGMITIQLDAGRPAVQTFLPGGSASPATAVSRRSEHR